ncbi:MAG TPA: MMPL family transporter, partial [Thermoleophilaceae bacterium]
MESTRNIAARAGRWSAQHRKKAILGWLAFVIVAVVIGGSVGTQTLSDADYGIGESGRADRAIADHSPEKEDESVLVQSQNGAGNRDQEFRQVVGTVVSRLEATKHVRKVESPYAADNPGKLSEDGKSALVTFELPGENAEDKVDPALNAVSNLDKQETGFRIEEFGGASADKALSDAFEKDFQKAEVTSLPITLIILIVAFGALLAAFVPLLLAITAVAAAISLLGPISQIWPVDENIRSVVLLIGLAVGVDYSLFYLRREREERARGRSEKAALEAAAATSGR